MPQQGIVHVIGPELGLTQPGMTIVCGDSHTATHGAFGRWRLASAPAKSSTCWPRRRCCSRSPKRWNCAIDGRLAPGVTAKDLILYLIGQITTDGGTGYVIEYTGEAIRALSQEERMTVCNMSIEAGRRAGMIAPDEKTFEYVRGREFAPQGKDFDAAVERWQQLPSDRGRQVRPRADVSRQGHYAASHLGNESRTGCACHRNRARLQPSSKATTIARPQLDPWSIWA